MPAKSSTQKSIALALQGGGTHSAFAWGVINQLLTDGRVGIEAVSASSGGAMLACVLAQGLHDGGPDGAREALKTFWKKVSIASGLLPLRMNVMDKFLGHVGIDLSPSTLALDYITRIFSPYQFNLFDINPLRSIVEEMVDFAMLKQKSPLQIFINATHAQSGKPEIFKDATLSLDAVMASSCLPFVFKTVEIDGEPYWDGSFSGSPALSPLVEYNGTRDIVLVQVHPSYVEEVPTAAADILDRATELSFHSVLLHELKNIELTNQLAEAGIGEHKPVYIHRIESQDMLASLGRASKLNAEWDFLVYLHDLGVQAATDWLAAHYDAIGKNSSTDVSAIAA
jgi:NTE family protein